MFSTPKDKSYKHELKGDLHRGKKKHRKALDEYQKALAVDERASLYDKLLATLEELPEEWTEEDFANSMFWEMKRQELSDPAFKRIHARSEPEFQEVFKLIKKMLDAKSQEDETKAAESIVAYGESALYPLIDFVLTFKEIGKAARKSK